MSVKLSGQGQQAVIYVGAGLLLLLVVGYFGKKMLGSVVSGDNFITNAARTDAYKDYGVLGTLGAATDILSGGTLSSAGEWLGDKFYEFQQDIAAQETPGRAPAPYDVADFSTMPKGIWDKPKGHPTPYWKS